MGCRTLEVLTDFGLGLLVFFNLDHPGANALNFYMQRSQLSFKRIVHVRRPRFFSFSLLNVGYVFLFSNFSFCIGLVAWVQSTLYSKYLLGPFEGRFNFVVVGFVSSFSFVCPNGNFEQIGQQKHLERIDDADS